MAQVVKSDGTVVVVTPENGHTFMIDEIGTLVNGIAFYIPVPFPNGRFPVTYDAMFIDQDGLSKFREGTAKANRRASMATGREIYGNVFTCKTSEHVRVE